jgi:hypothetical protein
MRRARQLAAFLLLVPVAAAQNPAIAPAEVTGVVVSTLEGGETRLELSLRGSAPEGRVIAAYPDSVVLDLPGVVYRGLPRRIPVNAAGVRAVRLWMQSEDPPLTRVIVEIDRTEQYLATFDGKGIVLRVGPVLEEASARTTPAASGSGAASPAGRGSLSANAASALGGIFRRGPGKASVSSNTKIRNGQPMPQDGVDAQTAESSNTIQNPSLQNPPLHATGAVASSQAPADQSSVSTGSASAAKPADTISASNPPPEPPAKEPPPSLEDGHPGTPSGSIPSPSAASPLPAEPPAAVSDPIKDPTNTPEAAPPPEVAPAPLPQPAAVPDPSTISAPDVVTFSAVANPGMRTEFHVKYVDQDAAYLDGGRSSGLTEGMKLIVKNKRSAAGADGSVDPAGAIAELVVVGLAETSAVTEIRAPRREVVAGDLAYLSSEDLQALVQQHALGATRKYPAVITFSEGGDALDEEARAFVPRPPLPSVNRASGRIGFDYSGTKSNDASGAGSSSIGAVVRADFTRIGGSYWNLRGYWRGRVSSTSSASSPQTLQDLLNRTYHLALTYESPNSHWTAGAGRLYLPWATSLETIDGGYFGRKLGHGITTGIFGGSTPDPTSWNYSPNRHIAGAFLNEEVGSYDAVRFSSTAGLGKSFNTVPYSTTTSAGTTTASYQDNRPFAFFENTLSYKRTFSIFSALQADQPGATPAAAAPGAGVSRSFLTVRVQPFSRLEFSANHTYFRDIPTFDPQLVSTGLLDKYLFQGFSGGIRVEVVKNIALYSDLGRSSRTGDAKTSLNQMYGITFLRIPKVLLHADAHYSRFTSSFGSGTYRSFSLSRNLGENFHAELLAGDQSFTSSLAGNQNAKFVTTNMDSSLGALFFLQGGFTVYRGQLQNYNQWNLTLGYRFDSKWKHK